MATLLRVPLVLEPPLFAAPFPKFCLGYMCVNSVARWVQCPRCCCVRLCIWMPIHRPDEIACCVSVIISGNDDILKSCNTYTINFTILWSQAFRFLSCAAFPCPFCRLSPKPLDAFRGQEANSAGLLCGLGSSIDLSVLVQAAFRALSESTCTGREYIGPHRGKEFAKHCIFPLGHHLPGHDESLIRATRNCLRWGSSQRHVLV